MKIGENVRLLLDWSTMAASKDGDSKRQHHIVIILIRVCIITIIADFYPI